MLGQATSNYKSNSEPRSPPTPPPPTPPSPDDETDQPLEIVFGENVAEENLLPPPETLPAEEKDS